MVCGLINYDSKVGTPRRIRTATPKGDVAHAKRTPMEWNAVLFLGAYHGVNPGMGWLFAVALGMQQGSSRGVWRAILPLALGHAAAVGVILLIAGLAQRVLPLPMMKLA